MWAIKSSLKSKGIFHPKYAGCSLMILPSVCTVDRFCMFTCQQFVMTSFYQAVSYGMPSNCDNFINFGDIIVICNKAVHFYGKLLCQISSAWLLIFLADIYSLFLMIRYLFVYSFIYLFISRFLLMNSPLALNCCGQ